MEEKYICETCRKEKNSLNKIAHQIYCQNKERIRGFSNKKEKDDSQINENKNDIIIRPARPRSRICQRPSNIQTIFSNNNEIQKEEHKINNIKYENFPKINLEDDKNLNKRSTIILIIIF